MTLPDRAGAAESDLEGTPKASGVLSWSQVIGSTARLFRLSFRVTFRRKLLFMTGGVIAYYALIYAISVYQPNEGFADDDALLFLVEIPGTVLAIYLTMDLVATERDRQTLETLLSTASSHYVIWIVRLISVFAVLLVTLVTMSTASYFLFAELPFLRGGLNAFVPAAVMVGVTFYASSWAKGANTAAMMAASALMLVLMFAEVLSETSYWLFLDPFEVPLGGNELFWTEPILLNRLGFLTVAGLFVFLGLRRMEQREKFLS